MIITKLEIQKNNKEKVNVFIDEKYVFSMTLNGIIENKIQNGMTVTEKDIENLKTIDEPKLAAIQALNIISYSMKTKKELEDKLKSKGFCEDAIEYAVNKMKELNYINDDYYVETYMKSRAIPQGWGDQKIISNLLQKGIKIEIIKTKISEIYCDDEKKDNILNLADKYLSKLSNDDDIKKKQKLYKFLLSKGYGYDLVNYAINVKLKNIQEEE